MFHFREIEEGSESFALIPTERRPVMEEIKAKIKETTGDWLAIDKDVRLGEMPASGSNEKLGYVSIIEFVNSVSSFVVEAYGSIHSILQVYVPTHKVFPAWTQSIFKISLSINKFEKKKKRKEKNQ